MKLNVFVVCFSETGYFCVALTVLELILPVSAGYWDQRCEPPLPGLTLEV